jgi:glycosyltransferase involved in cell wall biosynthesis
MNVVYPPTISFNLLYQRPQYILRKFAELGHTPIFYDSNPPYEGAEHCTDIYIEDGIRVVPPDTPPETLAPYHLYYSVSNHYHWTLSENVQGITYDLLDYPTEEQSFELLEKSLEAADNIFVVSDYLKEICETYTKNTATYIPNGVDMELFGRPIGYSKEASRIQALSQPSGKIMKRVINYSGVFWDEVTDWELFLKVCQEFKDDLIVVTGAFFQNYGKLPENVLFLGHVPRHELPACMAEADVSIIPFLQNNFTKAMCPLKFLEYCAVGTPVVSTPIPEVEKGPATIAPCHESFIEGIYKALDEYRKDVETPKVRGRKEYARMNSWSNVLKPMDKIFEV